MSYIIGQFKSPTGAKALAVFGGHQDLEAAREEYPMAAVAPWATTGHVSHSDLSLLQLALVRQGRGLYGDRVLAEMYGLAKYRNRSEK